MSKKKLFGGKSSAVASLLNIVGMAIAFAALYIIMVQVNYDLSYNKKIKDSDRIFLMTKPDWYTPGKWSASLSRPLCEAAINNVPGVESGGLCDLSYRMELSFSPNEDGNGSFTIMGARASLGALKALGFEAVEGNLDKLDPWKDIIISDTKAQEFGLHAGDVLYSRSSGSTQTFTIAGIYRHFPRNSDLYDTNFIINIGDESISTFSEWSYNYFVRLQSKDDKERFEEQAFEYILKTFLNMAGENGEEISDEDMEEARSRLLVKLFPLDRTYFDKTLGSPGRSGSKTSTYTLLAIAILVIVIAFINFINFFFALVPVRLRSVNTRKILGASRSSLAGAVIAESTSPDDCIRRVQDWVSNHNPANAADMIEKALYVYSMAGARAARPTRRKQP